MLQAAGEMAHGWTGLGVSAVACAAFMGLHALAVPLTRRLAPVLAAGLEKRGKLAEWRNYSVSYLFIWLCSAMLALIVGRHGMAPFVEPATAHAEEATLLVCIANGYMVADVVDMWRGRHLTADMRVHHGVIVLAYSLAIVFNRFHCYLAATLVAETNTIFLHARKLLLLSGAPKNGLPYRLAVMLLFLGFPAQRVLPHLYLLGQVYFDRAHFPFLWMFVVAFFGLAIINCLNFVLLRSLLLADAEAVLPAGLARAVCSVAHAVRPHSH